MKNLKVTLLLALVLIAFTASLRAEFLYVSYGKGLLSFSINRETGALTKLPGTPTLFPTGDGPLALARWGRLLYVSIGGSVFKGLFINMSSAITLRAMDNYNRCPVPLIKSLVDT